jgi:hypothetical protein
MLFGEVRSFAIESSDIFKDVELGPFVHLRFWVGGVTVGDWRAFVPLSASVEHANAFIENARYRRERVFAQNVAAEEVLSQVYDAFFSWDYRQGALSPNLRDRFHLDEIGLTSLQDKYGIVVVCTSEELDRVIVRDLVQGTVMADAPIRTGYAETVLESFSAWAIGLTNRPTAAKRATSGEKR